MPPDIAPPATILMATDLSARADRALTRAVHMARETGAALEVLHVVDQDLPPALRDAHHLQAERLVREQVAALAENTSVQWDVRIAAGIDIEEIIRHAEAAGAGVIVLGASRPGRFRSIVFGATANRVMRLSRVPVLVVKAGFRGAYRQVMAAVDTSPAAARALEHALAWWPEATTEAVHVTDPALPALLPASDEYSADTHDTAVNALYPLVHRLRHDTGHRLPLEIVEGQAGPALVARLKRFATDLAAIGSIGDTSPFRAAFGGTADHLIHEAPCDVLVVPPVA
ncbi:hypothetical protein C882_2057 [Caenispirillum salinarum AK4]|uniref:UspA domain-containing protein n=1 Tax=Caenispirillum salinarum AK4 TaxID=1238182 RepID=K9H974_9PROT|nr:universal stress protein [Caenispirillum salinarum]EKV27128.1 hypothetical protein C882_2057 [Caenispirillum salinarum AK4]